MYIRRTRTRRTDTGQDYFTCRLVRAERVGKTVRQRTLLNLGSHYDIDRVHWPTLCARIKQVLSGQTDMLDPACPAALETEAQRITAQLLARAPAPAVGEAPGDDMHSVAVDSLALLRPRAVGVEAVGLWALQQLGVPALLARLGLTGPQRAAALGSMIGRLAAPGSERATHAWLGQRSALGELLGVDFEAMSAMQLYRASDALLAHRDAIEQHLFRQVTDLFGLSSTVTLYDLTNTYFEGEAGAQPTARRGHSKEKRSDCPLLTLGLVLDGSGFVRRSQVFAGNVREDSTLAGMLTALDAPAGALVVMDRGIATEANIAWLREQGYRYLVVSRARHRQFDLEQALTIDSASGQPVHLHLEQGEGETRLYCYSAARAEKEKGMARRLQQRFETGLQRLADGLARPRTRKGLNSIHQRIGRLRERSRGIGRHYAITVTPDSGGKQAASITWQRQPRAGSLLTHPGVYCLRSNLTDWDAEKLWRTYTLLTDLEAVFRSLKSELGLRPVFHQTPPRAEGHLFITVLAYQAVQLIRRRLRAHGERASWSTLRSILGGQQRVTATFRCADQRTLHVRKATRPEAAQQAIYAALGIDENPGGTQKTVV